MEEGMSASKQQGESLGKGLSGVIAEVFSKEKKDIRTYSPLALA